MRWVLRIAVVIVALPLLLWGALALYFAGPRPVLLAEALAAALLIAGIAIVLFLPRLRAVVALAVVAALWFAWWTSLTPRNDREWLPDVAKTATVERDGDRLTIHNVRNFIYRSETEYTPRWEIRTVDLSRLTGVDLFMSYWGSPMIAHTIMSWGFDDGQHIAISIETRKETGEEYSAVKGFFKQFELYYVVADERDVVRLRTNYRKENVYLYPLHTTVERARSLLLDYVESINELAAKPEFYNAATANCTTTIRTHVKHIGAANPLDWRIFVNGYMDQMLYERGVIDTTRPFAEVRQASFIDARAQAADKDPAFSARIREGIAPAVVSGK